MIKHRSKPRHDIVGSGISLFAGSKISFYSQILGLVT